MDAATAILLICMPETGHEPIEHQFEEADEQHQLDGVLEERHLILDLSSDSFAHGGCVDH